jgi:hypothetical protein
MSIINCSGYDIHACSTIVMAIETFSNPLHVLKHKQFLIQMLFTRFAISCLLLKHLS